MANEIWDTISPYLAPLVTSAITPTLNDIASGGLLDKSTGMLQNAGSGIAAVQQPNLMALIPQLQLQVQQGTMTPAQANAALAQLQGSVDPATYQAAQTQLQGSINPSTYEAALAQVQGQMTPAQSQLVQAVQQGTMTPAQALTALQADSNMKGVNTDQASINGMKAALDQLNVIGQNQGMTDADRAQFQSAMNLANSNAASQRNAQIQQLQMQGNAGGGSELAARLSGGQNIANANSAAGATLAQSAQARALAAIQAGVTGNQALNQQLFSQDAQKAQAQDLVNQFNAQAQNTTNLANAQNQQGANLANFNTANQMALANANNANQMNQYNATNAQNAGLANFNTANQMAALNAGAQNTAGQYNATNTQNAATNMFNTQNQLGLANTAAQNTAGQYNATNTQAANTTNFNVQNQLAQSNATNQQNANQYNANNQQQANLKNFDTANTIAGTNTGIQNTQAMLPLSTAQQQYTNQIGQQTAAANANLYGGKALGDMATAQVNRSNSAASQTNTPTASGGTSSLLNTVGNAVIDNAGSIWDTVSGWFSDETLKTDKKELTDDEVDNMMAQLTGYKYRYKGDKSNPEQTGVMAQDMERGMPGSVVDTPAGKMVQKPEAMSQALAILANQHNRIKQLEGKQNGR